MDIDIEIANYRCFGDDPPAKFTLRPGTSALLGLNNSGKSTLLRALATLSRSLTPAFEASTVTSMVAGQQHIAGFSLYAESWHQAYRRDTTNPTWMSVRSGGVGIELRQSATGFQTSILRGKTRFEVGPNTAGAAEFGRLLNISSESVSAVAAPLRGMCYIPALRSAQSTSGGQLWGFPSGAGLINQWHSLTTGEDLVRDRVYSVTDDIAAAIGEQVSDVFANTERNELLVRIDGRSFGISELGSGISDVVSCLVGAYILKPAWILIDEPESHLHPKVQQRFVETLSRYATHGLVLATHSVGLARAVADQMYWVERTGDTSTVRSFTPEMPLVQAAGELGWSALREVGYGALLLVEGATDVPVAHQFLRMYGLAGHVYVMHLGGGAMASESTLAELPQLKALAPKVYAILDSETPHQGAACAPERSKFKSAFDAHFPPENCLLTERRAIENYFPQHALTSELGNGPQTLGPYEGRKGSSRAWPKSRNGRIAARMKPADLTGTDIERFFLAMTR